MDDASSRLLDALTAAYRPFLTDRLAALGLPALDEAVLVEAEDWLHAQLAELLGLPYQDQRRSPLEVFQEAMRLPTEALQARGVVPPPRDPVEVSALPGDLYRLAPASSAGLGESVWGAHLAWGAAKAAAVAPLVLTPGAGVPPLRAVLINTNLLDRDRLEGAARAAGYDFAAWSSLPEPLPASLPTMAFVDLEHRQSDEAVRRLSQAGVRVVAYGPHVDDVAMMRARRLGATAALPRSRLFRSPGDYLPPLL